MAKKTIEKEVNVEEIEPSSKSTKKSITLHVHRGPHAGLKRTFSHDEHGEDFALRAESFKKKFNAVEVVEK